MSFLALDAMLGWKVKHYESSWLEWGNLSDEEGTLAQNSPWRTDCGIPGATACTLPAVPVTDAGNSTVTNSNSPLSSCSSAAAADATNENDKQICATGIQNTDCNGFDN